MAKMTRQQQKAMFAKGARVSFDGKNGTITRASSGYPQVTFDDGLVRTVFAEGLEKIKNRKSIKKKLAM